MTKNISTILVILLNFLFFPVTAQNVEISGTVKDKDNLPIINSNITLSNVNDPLIIAFTRSDHQGNFKLKVSQNLPLGITVKKPGYQTESRLLKNSENLNVIFSLRKDTILRIDEVVINRKIKISTKGDTTNYHLDAFRLGGERNLEEALSRLPGFEVKEDGKISINGRSIQKILIEGDDLVSGQYTLLSKNLSPDLIEDVQVLDNFLDDPFLKTASRSDDIALNLKFKEKFKNSVISDASLELGITDRYNINLNNILLSRRTKLYALTSLNNIGNDISNVKIDRAIPSSIVNSYNPEINFKPISDIGPGDVPRLERRRWFNNNSNLFSINAIQSLTDRLSVKLNAGLSYTENQREKSMLAQYFLSSDSILSYSEKHDWKGKNLSFNSNIQLNYLVTANQRIRYEFEATAVRDTDNSIIVFENAPVQQLLKVNNQNVSNHLNYVNRFKDKSFLSLDIFYKTHLLPQNYNVVGYDYSSFFKSEDDHGLHQNLRISGNLLGARSTYYFKAIGFHTVGRVGYERESDSFSSASSPSFSSNKQELPQTNDYTYNVKKKYAEIEIERNLFKKIDIRGLMNISRLKLRTAVSGLSKSLDKFIFLPDLKITFTPSRKEKWILGFKRTIRPTDITQLFQTPIFSSYRYATSYTDSLYFRPTDNVSLSYRFNNAYSQFSINTTVFYAVSEKNFISDNWVSEKFNISNKIVGSQNRNFGLVYGSSKFIPSISNTLKFAGSFFNFSTQNLVNGSELRNINNLTFDNTISLISTYGGVFNYIAAVQKNESKSLVKLETGRRDYNTSFLKFQLTSNLRFRRDFFLQAVVARYQWKNNETSQKPFISLDGSLQKKIFKDKFTMSLTAWNILDSGKLSFNQTSDFYENEISYPLLGRMLLLGGKFSF